MFEDNFYGALGICPGKTSILLDGVLLGFIDIFEWIQQPQVQGCHYLLARLLPICKYIN